LPKTLTCGRGISCWPKSVNSAVAANDWCRVGAPPRLRRAEVQRQPSHVDSLRKSMNFKKPLSSSCSQLPPPSAPSSRQSSSRLSTTRHSLGSIPPPRLAQTAAATAAAVAFTMKLRGSGSADLHKAFLPPLTPPTSSKKLFPSGQSRDARTTDGGVSPVSLSRPVTPDTQSSTPKHADEALSEAEKAEQSQPGWAAAKDFLARAALDSRSFSKQTVQRIRQVFDRFKDQNSHEMNLSDLHHAASHLGYVGVTKEATLEIARQLSEYPTLTRDEFGQFLELLAVQEQTRIAMVFSKYASKLTKKVAVPNVSAVLHDLGMTSLQMAITESLETAQLSSYKALTVNQFRYFLAAHISSEGFTEAQRTEAREAFDHAREEGKPDLPLHCVGAALARFQGPDAADRWSNLWCRLGSHISSSEESEVKADQALPGASVDFHEFLVWARRLEIQELAPLHAGFRREDRDRDRLVSEGEFLQLLEPDLSVLFSGKLSQVFADANIPDGKLLSFDEVVHVLRTLRSTNNQTKQQIRELEEVFRLFDTDDSGKMDVTEMVDVLMYLGFPSTLEGTQELMRWSDVDGNEELDLSEFMSCMRHHEIMQCKALRSAYDQVAEGEACNHLELSSVLVAMEIFPGQAKLDVMLAEEGLDQLEEFDFRSVCQISQRCRLAVAKVNRQRACFPAKHVQTLEKLWQEYAPSGTMDRGGLICLLSVLELPMNTSKDRETVFSSFDAARLALQIFGVEEVSFADSHMLTFSKLLHLLRLVCVRHRRTVMERELAALNAAGIAQSETVEFREVFRSLALEKACAADAGAVQKAPSNRRRSMPATAPAWEAIDSVTTSSNLRHQAHHAIADLKAFLCVGGKGLQLAVQDVMDLLMDLGVGLSSKQQMELKYKATSFAAQPSDAVDFATFIQLIRWMLDVNLGDINTKTSGNIGAKGFQAASAALSTSLRSRFPASRRASAS